jgi:molybdopterin converting factor small subunit
MAARVKVRLFHELRSTLGQSEIELEANTLSDEVESLISTNGPVKELLFDAHGKLRTHTMFYINNTPKILRN